MHQLIKSVGPLWGRKIQADPQALPVKSIDMQISKVNSQISYVLLYRFQLKSYHYIAVIIFYLLLPVLLS